MAFTAGLNKPQVNQNNNSGKSIQSKRDRLLTVDEYDLGRAAMFASDSKGNKYEIIVDPITVANIDASHKKNGTDTSKSPYVGHKIDEKMKKTSPIGSKVIVQKSEVLQNNRETGVKKTQIQRIFKVANPEPNKTFEGIVSVTYRMDDGKKKVARAYVWDDRAIDVNNEKSLSELKEKMDAAAALSGTKIGEFNVSVPTYGFQLRASEKTDRKNWDGGDIYVAIDTSIPFDWIPGPLDEAGKEIKSQAHTVGGEEMMSIVQQYIDHISEHEAFKNNLDNMLVEVCPYKIYPASNNDDLLLTKGDPEKDKHADKSPLYQSAHLQNYVDMDNSKDGLITGKNSAIYAIVQLTADRPEKINGKYEEIQTNWVNRIHTNNARGHVHAFVRTEAGAKVEAHERLDFVNRPQKRTDLGNSGGNSNGNSNSNGYSSSSNNGYGSSNSNSNSSHATPVAPAVVATPVVDNSEDSEEFDPFLKSAPTPGTSSNSNTGSEVSESKSRWTKKA